MSINTIMQIADFYFNSDHLHAHECVCILRSHAVGGAEYRVTDETVVYIQLPTIYYPMLWRC